MYYNGKGGISLLGIQLEIQGIQYEKCVEALLPQLVEHCAAKMAPNELDRFLASLGADAVPAAPAAPADAE